MLSPWKNQTRNAICRISIWKHGWMRNWTDSHQTFVCKQKLAEAHLIRASGFNVEHQGSQVMLVWTICVQILRSQDLISRIPYTHVIYMTYGTQDKRKCNNWVSAVQWVLVVLVCTENFHADTWRYLCLNCTKKRKCRQKQAFARRIFYFAIDSRV